MNLSEVDESFDVTPEQKPADLTPDWSKYPGNYPPAFVRFNDKNDWVYHAIVRRARELKKRGFKGVGVRFLYEELRYGEQAAAMREANPEFEFGLDNDHAAFYGRMIEAREIDLEGFFRLRPLSRVISPMQYTLELEEFD